VNLVGAFGGGQDSQKLSKEQGKTKKY